LYRVSVRYGNRTIGHGLINVTKTETATIKCWVYNLTVTCVDQENKPLPGHVVFLYDQLVFHSPTRYTVLTDRAGRLVNWSRTDEKGIARFADVWNGTYMVRVMAGEIIGEEILSLQKAESRTLRCNKTYLVLRFITESNEPLTNATVYIYNSAGHLLFRDYTDRNGYIRYVGIYLDDYAVFAEWGGVEVWSGPVDVYKEREWTIKCPVFRLTLQVVDPFGNALPNADITFRKRVRRWGRWTYVDLPFKFKTDENGHFSQLLPSDTYVLYCTEGMYLGSLTVDLKSNYADTVFCSIQPHIWVQTFFITSPIIALALLLERRKLKRPLEIRRYKNMLSRLDSMYKNGLVEYKIYRKLREEYEAKLMELGGREVR
ncbi:MAG: collagen binding domain-containing protein, partial [Candidatus Bathyarchaeia archaeon]